MRLPGHAVWLFGQTITWGPTTEPAGMMMRFSRLNSGFFATSVMLVVWLAASTAYAGPMSMPGVLAKSWAVGYSIFGLAVLLGVLAVTVTSKRKTIRKRD